MNQTILAATLAAAFTFFTGAVRSAQATQEDHVTEAVKETQAAIDAGNSGQKDLVVQHAKEALTHAELGEKEHRSPKLEGGIRNLRQAGKKGEVGKGGVAQEGAQAALQEVEGWRGVG